MIDSAAAPGVTTRFSRIGDVFLAEARREMQTQPRTPLLMIHGAFHGWWAYKRWLGYFAALGFPSYALSLRGHEGAAPLDAEKLCSTGMADYAQDVQSALDAIGEPAVLIGHSLGGLMAQMVAAKSSAVRALVLVGTAGPAALGATRDFVWPEDTALLFPPDRMRRSMFHQISDGDFAAIYGRLVPESPRALNDSGLAGVHVEASAIKAPVLVIGTQYDGIGLHKSEAVASYYGASLVNVPGTSHDCLVEDAGLDAAHEILRWLMMKNLDQAQAT
jgi:pimeloyl-ACP methyl ester carboxylesterase